mmetsp:Transcript_1990/g.4531  ORF Transcript_1990/g.4531 Transcript_1990/m.4531 type:complete len:638 (+) Transcript_1990:112-2025(+)
MRGSTLPCSFAVAYRVTKTGGFLGEHQSPAALPQRSVNVICLLAILSALALVIVTALWAKAYFLAQIEDVTALPTATVEDKKKFVRQQLSLIKAEECWEEESARRAAEAEIAAQKAAEEEPPPEDIEYELRLAEFQGKLVVATTVSKALPFVTKVVNAREEAQKKRLAAYENSVQLLRKQAHQSVVSVLDSLRLTRLHDSKWKWTLPAPHDMVAGAMAPYQMEVFRWFNYFSLFVFVCFLGFLAYAAIADTVQPDGECSIPGLLAWGWTIVVVVFVLVLARIVFAVQTESNLSRLSAFKKQDDEKYAHIDQLPQAEQLKLSALRAMTISGRALLLWDEIANSKLTFVLLLGILAFGAVGIWGIVLAVMSIDMAALSGAATAAGASAGQRVAQAQADAPDATLETGLSLAMWAMTGNHQGRQGLVCGYTNLVFAVRLFSFLFVLGSGLFMLLAVTAVFAILRQTGAIGMPMLSVGRGIDSSFGGLPIATTLVKALYAREEVDPLQEQASLTKKSVADLTKEVAALEAEKDALQAESEKEEAAIASLNEQISAVTLDPRLQVRVEGMHGEMEKGMEDFRHQVEQTIPPSKVQEQRTKVDGHIRTYAAVATGLEDPKKAPGLGEVFAKVESAWNPGKASK